MTKRDIYPDHPGILLKEEFLDPMDIKPGTLAVALQVPRDRITEIVKGNRDITPDTALRLSAYFGTSADFWLNLKRHYDLVMAEKEFNSKIFREIKISSKSLIHHSAAQI